MMTTYPTEQLPTMRDFLAAKVHSLLMRKRSKAKEATRVTAVLGATVRVILHLAGFALLTLAAFQWNIIAGLAIAGISCFVMSTLMTTDTAANGSEMEGRRAQDLRTGR